MTQENNEKQGAVVNAQQLFLMFQLFRIHPWSYSNEDPFKLMEVLDEQDHALKESTLL